MMAPTIAIRATKPIVNPTAPPVFSPLPLLFFTPNPLCEFGGAVGVTVTVRTSPVVVKIETMGVGVHVVDVEEDSVVDMEAWLVVDAGSLVVEGAAPLLAPSVPEGSTAKAT
jgi:hypothetical protein